MPAGALLAGVVEHPLRDALPDRVAAIQWDCIGGLNYHGPLAAAAADAQDVALDFRKTSLPHLGPGRAGARSFSTGSQYSAGRGASGAAARGPVDGRLQRPVFPSALGWACASSRVGPVILEVEHTKNSRVESDEVGSMKKSSGGKPGEPSLPDRLESGISNGVPPTWPPALIGKASCAFLSSPVR
jgi:hypothetical protein